MLLTNHLCGGVALLGQAQLEAEDLRQSLLSRSLTGEVQVMEMEEAYKQVRRVPTSCASEHVLAAPLSCPHGRRYSDGWMGGQELNALKKKLAAAEKQASEAEQHRARMEQLQVRSG